MIGKSLLKSNIHNVASFRNLRNLENLQDTGHVIAKSFLSLQLASKSRVHQNHCFLRYSYLSHLPRVLGCCG